VIVGYGTVVPNGSLPVYSVDSEEEAERLLTLTCGTNVRGEHFARELAENQTIENLFAFGERLAKAHDFMQKKGKGANVIRKRGRKSGS
jgi:hypothetical protein